VIHPPSTLVYLEQPWSDATGIDAAVLGTAFLMGLRYTREYWGNLAMQWAELGFSVTDEAVDKLNLIAASSPKKLSQQLRHRAAVLFRRVGEALLPNRSLQRTVLAPAELWR